ncbi:CPBP family intramembrane glutamic endopeptidase [Brachybacterium hainanense]|uniref:CPBP family intramembrane glutamic endopeptidase n=1 Tax=Brachybacterium hainanense TaxID=1541174 RepID=A0ABV6RDJ1_9MICO
MRPRHPGGWHDGAVSIAIPPRLLRAEVLIVLALSLGRSAVYSVLALAEAFARGPLAGQSTALNPSASELPWMDLIRQLTGIVFTLAPVALAIVLLALTAGSVRQALGDIGLDLRAPGRDLLWGFVLAAVIGVPGLGIYAAGRALGATLEVVPASLGEHWWTVPVLVLQAVKNAVIEEVIAVGYLARRLEALGWGPRRIIAASALLRGAYHLYQGIGPGIANAVMGVVFAGWFRRTGRVMPLVIAHTLLDVVAFVGYALLKDVLGL